MLAPAHAIDWCLLTCFDVLKVREEMLLGVLDDAGPEVPCHSVSREPP